MTYLGQSRRDLPPVAVRGALLCALAGAAAFASCANQPEQTSAGLADQTAQLGSACATDLACDPGDLCAAGQCLFDLAPGAFSVTPAAATVATTVGQHPGGVTFTLADSTKSGHPFDVVCDGGAVPSPASGKVSKGRNASLTLVIPPRTAPGSTTFRCDVTSTQAKSARAGFSLTVEAVAPVPGDFSLAASPASLSVAQGSAGSASISVSGTPGFADGVSLSVSGLPAGASATFPPQPVAAGESATLSLQAGTAATGTYPLVVTGHSGALAHAVPIALEVTPASDPDFTLTVSPAALPVVRGESATASVVVTLAAGFRSGVQLSVTGLPSGVTALFSQPTVTPGASTALTLTASAAAAIGSSAVMVIGKSGAHVHTAPLALEVQGGSGGGAIGPTGGSVDLLDFVMTGDTRPPACDQNQNYPTAIHAQIVQAMGRLKPQFGLALGDFMYVCSQKLANAQFQMGAYVDGLKAFPSYFALTMGNHECEGGKDCSANPADVNYSTFLAALSQVSQQRAPNYALQIQTRRGRATVVVVADNSFSAVDQAWLERTLADADLGSAYTIIAKHHPVTGSRTGPAAPWQIISKHKYSLLLMGHNHDYEHKGSNVTPDGRGVICGLGGANVSHTGFCRVQQAADGRLDFTQYDANGNPGDAWSVAPQ